MSGAATPDHLELLDLTEEALEADAPWFTAEPQERAALATVAKELVKSPAHPVVELRENVVEDALLVLMSNRAQEPLEAPARRSFDLRASKPLADPLVERAVLRLTRQRVREQPGAEGLPRRLAEGADSEQLQDPLAMPPASAVVPSVVVEVLNRGVNLLREVGDDGRREVAALLGEPAMPPIERELRQQPEAPLLLLVEQQMLVTRLDRPLLDQLLRRPLPLHPRRSPLHPPLRSGEATSSVGSFARPRCKMAKVTASWSLGLLAGDERVAVIEVKRLECTLRTPENGAENGWRSEPDGGFTRVDNGPARVGRRIHYSWEQLGGCSEPKVLVFVNDDRGFMDVKDLEEAFNGFLDYGTDKIGYRNTASAKIAKGTIRTEKGKIDLYIWIDRWKETQPQPIFRFTNETGHALARRFFGAP